MSEFNALPVELQLLIVDAVPVNERSGRATLALASPRLLAASRELPSCQGLEMSLAFHHALGGAIDEHLLRRYIRHSEATPEGCEWLAGFTATDGLQISVPRGLTSATEQMHLFLLAASLELPSYQGLEMSLAFRYALGDAIDEPFLRRYVRYSEATPEGCEWLDGLAGDAAAAGRLHIRVVVDQQRAVSGNIWHLARSGATIGALTLLRWQPRDGICRHFEGRKGAERLVCCELLSGQVKHFNGAKHAEFMVRCELPSGEVQHFEGEKGAERMVREEQPSGVVCHYEGEKGAERMVREELPSGVVCHYEGEKGAERMARQNDPSGVVQHFEGERGVEYVVRLELPSGEVQHFEGETLGAERLVRCVGLPEWVYRCLRCTKVRGCPAVGRSTLHGWMRMRSD